MTTSSLGALLKRGSTELNKLKQAGKLPLEFTGDTIVDTHCANADLSSLDLTGTEWDRCELSKCSFRNANLSNAYFHGGRLHECDFTGASLDGASFEKVKMLACDFTNAKGLDELELTDVDMRDVIGLESLDDDDDDDDENEAEEEGEDVVYLDARLPKGYKRMSLDDILLHAGKHVTITVGDPLKQADLTALEAALAITFPADYRAFLMRFGRLAVRGSARHAFGEFDVFGATDLPAVHARYLALFEEHGLKPGWLEAPITKKSPELRAKLRDALKLSDAQLKGFVGDDLDAMRIAYRFMVPVMATPDEFHRMVECCGPDTQMYTVSIKDREVEPPSGTFTARLLANLEKIIVA